MVQVAWVSAAVIFLLRALEGVREDSAAPVVFFRRRLFERVGPLETAYHFAMDYHLWLRMGEASPPAFLDRELAFFRISGENKTSRSYRESFREELDAARRVAAGRHPLLLFLHAIPAEAGTPYPECQNAPLALTSGASNSLH